MVETKGFTGFYLIYFKINQILMIIFSVEIFHNAMVEITTALFPPPML